MRDYEKIEREQSRKNLESHRDAIGALSRDGPPQTITEFPSLYRAK